MIITSLAADGFKNLDKVLIKPHSEYNLITGENAQGKTNLLEAVWLMTGCKSFRGSKDREFIALDRRAFTMGMEFDDGRRKQIISYVMSRDNPKEKKINLNGVHVKGTGRLFENFKCVVFTPDDIDIIKGSPEKRRNFIDLCSCQLKHRDLGTIKRYEALILNRNALLKDVNAGKADSSLINLWDEQVAAMGTLVSQIRYSYIKKLNECCKRLYKIITDGKENLEISYNSNIFGNEVEDVSEGEYAVARYYKKLYDSNEDDIRLGYTLWGAHRDDVVIKINGMNIKDYGSQGQKKTAALTLKLGQAEIYYKNRDEAPVILLDDVMGELDKSRQKLVFEVVKGMQVFITSCNENAVKNLGNGNHYRVEKGVVSLQEE